MKKLNKYLLLLAAAVFTFTACEKEIEREPSPEAPAASAAFKGSGVEVDINPVKAPLEYNITLVRGNKAEALTVGIEVVEGDADIILVPSSVSFDKDAGEASLKLTFPGAQLDSSYSIVLAIKKDNQSPYIDGAGTFTFKVNIASWEAAAAPAIFVDGVVCSPFGMDPIAWYVEFQEKLNSDGSKDYRFINPYRQNEGDEEADQFGIYSWFVYNSGEQVDLANPYNWEMHVDVEGNVTFPKTYLGPDYGYGAAIAWLYADFLAAKDGSEPDYETNGCGKYDDATKSIIFPAGVMLWYFDGYGGNLTSLPQIVYLDSKAYQDDHLSIADYNAEDIEWKEVESAVNQFESTIFNFTNEEQKLFKAKDQYEGNPKSPFINLYCLKDAYAKGGNLAFYWDGEDGEIVIPAEQDTKLSFMGQELLIKEGAGIVATSKVKGVDVKVFTFDIVVVSEEGNEVGEFIETFTMAGEEIIYEKADYLGYFKLRGLDPWDDSEREFDLEIKEDGDYFAVLGIDVDTIWGKFDAEKGALSLLPQMLPDSFSYKGANYARAFLPMDAKGTENYKESLVFKFKLNGTAPIAADCDMVGFWIYIPDLGGAADGAYDLTLIPSEAPAEEPGDEPGDEPNDAPRRIGQKHFKASNVPGVDHLSFKGQYQRKVKMAVKF